MALRFRRTMKIAPGVRLNLTKTGISARIGPRGAGATIGTSGTTVSAGIPGTGLHASEKLKGNKRRPAQQTVGKVPQETKKLGVFGWLGAFFVIGAIIWMIF